MSLQQSALKCIDRYSNTQPGSPPHALEALEDVVGWLEWLDEIVGSVDSIQDKEIHDALEKAKLVLCGDRGQDAV